MEEKPANTSTDTTPDRPPVHESFDMPEDSPRPKPVPAYKPPEEPPVKVTKGAWVTSRKFRYILALLIALFIGPFVRSYLIKPDLKEIKLANSTYLYTFKFYENPLATQVKDAAAYTYKHTAVVLAEPTQDEVVTSCLDIGDGWSQAFMTSVNGSDRPVCTLTSGNAHIYATNFSAFDTTHMFTVTYNTEAKDAGKLSGDTAALKTMFSSVKVEQQP